jgi:hypothetical protein
VLWDVAKQLHWLLLTLGKDIPSCSGWQIIASRMRHASAQAEVVRGYDWTQIHSNGSLLIMLWFQIITMYLTTVYTERTLICDMVMDNSSVFVYCWSLSSVNGITGLSSVVDDHIHIPCRVISVTVTSSFKKLPFACKNGNPAIRHNLRKAFARAAVFTWQMQWSFNEVRYIVVLIAGQQHHMLSQ